MPLALHLFASIASVALSATSPLGYYRQPAIHGDTIVFVAEGDLWRVSAAGGTAARLTSHPGDELQPAISADGARVAFVASYEGPTEAYVMPMVGGRPDRLTFDGATVDTVGWSPDGRVIVATRGRSTLPDVQLALVGPGTPDVPTPTFEMIPLAQAADATFMPAPGAPDGRAAATSIVFTRQRFQGSHAKRYQGGTAQNLWRFDAGAAEATPLTADWLGTSRQPMWFDGRVYFVSDRDGTMNLWSMTPDGKDLKQHTRHAGWDVLGPSIDPSGSGRIVYQLGADLRLFDARSGEDRAVSIALASDLDQTREQWIAKPLEFLTSAHISPDGKRVALTARGRSFVAPAKQGRLVEVERESTARTRDVRFLPAADKKDATTLLALSDRSGEVEFWTLPADGVNLPPNVPRQLTRNGTVLRWQGVPSPDGKLVAHTDKDQKLWLLDIASGADTLVGQNLYGDWEQIAWSPDSAWFAVVSPSANLFTQVMLVRAADRTMTPVTTDRFDSFSPFFAPDGKWLYLVSNRNLVTVVKAPWGPYQPEPAMLKTGKLYMVPLVRDVRSPFAPLDELMKDGDDAAQKDKDKDKDKPKPGETPAEKPVEKPAVAPATAPAGDAKPGDKPTDKPAEKAPEPPKPVVVELEGIAARLQEVPVPPGAYSSLAANAKTLFWLSADPESEAKSLVAMDISREEQKVVTVAEKVTGYELSLDGQTLLVQRENAVHVVPAKAVAADLPKTQVDLSGWLLGVVPRDAWRQMFLDAWRLHRDYFYDPSMHGVDWNAMREKYLPLVDRVTTRQELSDVLAQMISELSALHASVAGGDARKGNDQIRVGELGAILERDDAAGGWRVVQVYRHDPDEPGAAPPLSRPDATVAVGEVIVRINGVPTLSVVHPSLLLRGNVGKQVLLHVKPLPKAEGQRGNEPNAQSSNPAGNAPGDTATELRRVIVRPVSSETARGIRYTDWELSRRAETEKLGEGRIGYVHLRAMGEEDWTDWARNFFPVFTREGLVIDVRHNRGGNIDSWILGRLMRKAWFGWSSRVGNPPVWNMQFAFRGHVAVLCDEWTASDGEALSEGIKRLGLGTVIGTRTWGGEIWLSAANVLVDKGIATAAENGVFGPEGVWLVEGRGVEPDIVVDNLPHETFAGRDRQLEAAIDFLKGKMAAEPVAPLTRPAFPNKSK